VGALAALVLAGAWFSWRGARAPVRPTATPIRNPTASSVPIAASPSPVFTIAHVRDGGQSAGLRVYREAAGGNLCVSLTTEGVLSCDFLPRLGQGATTIRLAYAHWLYWDSARFRYVMFLVGAIGPSVASVRVSLGVGRSVDATILTLPPELAIPFRLFYTENRTGFQDLSRLPVVALDDQGREIGRTSYLVLGG
jgi:hypothetical protein